MIKKMMPIYHKEDPDDDDPKNVHDTTSTGDSKDDTYVEICCGDRMKEEEDMIGQTIVSHNDTIQWQGDLSQLKPIDKIDMTDPTSITKYENLDENSGASAIINNRGNADDPVTRQEHEVLTGASHPRMVEMTPEEREAKEQEELSTGLLRVLTNSVRDGTQILIDCSNNKKLLGRVKAFDRHYNMVLEEVTEMWTEQPKTGRSRERTDSSPRCS